MALPEPAAAHGDRVQRVEARLSGEHLQVALVCSRFNELVTGRLAEGARSQLARHGVSADAIFEVWAPGAFELPLVAARLARSARFDAIVCLGAVVRGATDHYEHVASQCAAGIRQAQLDTGVPIAFGVLTTSTLSEALERAGGKAGNKGAEAALSALEMANLLRILDKPWAAPPAGGGLGGAEGAG
ncbi:MAG: 6,7-dimethyl-8-ribityllumazine synthase [Acidimicrobiales bacterium]